MTREEWWKLVDDNDDALVALVERFHPRSVSRERGTEFPITAQAAEEACEAVRQMIEDGDVDSPGPDARCSIDERDGYRLSGLLSDTWFGMPESTEVRSLPGFDALCRLLDDPVEEE